jgi:hypothetical protein
MVSVTPKIMGIRTITPRGKMAMKTTMRTVQILDIPL